MVPQKKTAYIFFFLIVLLLVLFLFDLKVGSVKISWNQFFGTLFGTLEATPFDVTIFEFRLPKAIVAILTGAALSVSGLQMQTIFRNPLAGPYILGISSGAGLGVALVVMGFSGITAFSLFSLGGQWAMVIAAWMGAALLLLIILLISMRIKHIMTILIFGIMFGSAASAIVSILQYFSTDASLKSFVLWSMGSLSGVTNKQMLVFAPGILVGLLLALVLPKNLNALLIGENYARSMGLNVQFTRVLVFVSTSLLAGTVTAFCGPIGFIGIAVPHIGRMVFKTANHRILIPASLLLGANVMLFSDIISQVPNQSMVLPINSITALLGIPVVIYIVISNQKFTTVA